VEQRLARALGWLKARTGGTLAKLGTLASAWAPNSHSDEEAMQRMGLDSPASLRDRISARLLRLALAKTVGG
jgi:hypothetical protein